MTHKRTVFDKLEKTRIAGTMGMLMFGGLVLGISKCESMRRDKAREEFYQNFRIDSAANEACIDLNRLEELRREFQP